MKKPISNDQLANIIARSIFKVGDVRKNKCQRIQFKGGDYPDKETDNGGYCETALAHHVLETLDRYRKD